MFTVEVLQEAKQEIKEACEWYRNKQAGLDVRFWAEIKRQLQLLSQHPDIYPVRFSEKYRFTPLKTFPYFIVYRLDEEKKAIFIISIFHTSRNPSKF